MCRLKVLHEYVMRINLSGKTNSDKVFLNTIILVIGGGRTGKPEREITLDREETGWSTDDKGNINITFETPYIWDGEGMDYDGQTIVNAIDEARGFYAEIEDDAPADYQLKLTELFFIDSYGEEHSLHHKSPALKQSNSPKRRVG